mgnify:CR=1 FL=1
MKKYEIEYKEELDDNDNYREGCEIVEADSFEEAERKFHNIAVDMYDFQILSITDMKL